MKGKKNPCLYVPTLEAKKAFLEVAHARGYMWGQTLAASLKFLNDNQDRHYAVEHWAKNYVDFAFQRLPGHLIVNSPRQFFAYLQA